MKIQLFFILLTLSFACKLTIIGGGVGGLYGAFRLANSSAYNASDICIFEKTNRVGGRAHTVHIFPTRSTLDIGAHKFETPHHEITASLVYNVLNLKTACYSKTGICNGANEGSFYFLRNSYTGNLDKSRSLPYFFNPEEEWNKQNQPNFVFEILAHYPFILDNIENLTSSNPAVRYPAMKGALDTARTYQVNGMYPHQYTIRTLLNHSSEFWQFLVDTEGEALSTIPLVNVYDALRNILYYASDYTELTEEKVIVNDNGDEIGYSTISERLANLLINMGANITFNKEAIGVYTQPDQKLLIKFRDGSQVITEKLILNIPPKQLLDLSADSIMFSNETVNRLYKLFDPICAVKGYFYYNKSWWLPIVNNDMAATNELRYFEYLDSNSDGNTTNSAGYVNIVYADGHDYCEYYRSVQKDKTNPLVVIYKNTTDPIEAKMFNDLIRLLAETQAQVLDDTGITNVPDPEILVMGIWTPAWHQISSSDYFGGEPSRLMLQPISSLPIYFINEGFSVDQGWSEGSLIMAEKVAVMLGNLNSRPSWLGNQYWYDAVIVNNI